MGRRSLLARHSFRLAAAVLFSSLFTGPTFAAFTELDVATERRAPPDALARLEHVRNDPAAPRFATLAHVDERYAVPSFLWGRADAMRVASSTPEQAARAHLEHVSAWYG